MPMFRVGFEHTISASERAKTVPDLDLSANEAGYPTSLPHGSFRVTELTEASNNG
jgi:hypothetical protein